MNEGKHFEYSSTAKKQEAPMGQKDDDRLVEERNNFQSSSSISQDGSDSQPLAVERNDRTGNTHGASNFQNQNAFEDSLVESPIRRRFDADGTLMMDKNSSFLG